jgi:hypothetical protein
MSAYTLLLHKGKNVGGLDLRGEGERKTKITTTTTAYKRSSVLLPML